ncbi:MAG: hypothetical protein OHK0040_09520 [bacterium]
MAITLELNELLINFESEKTPPLSFSLVEGDKAALILSRDFYERALLNFFHLLVEDFEGDALFCGKSFRSFDEETKKQWFKSFASVSLIFPMISNLKVIENVYLPIFYREGVKEQIFFDRAYSILTNLGIEKKFNVLPAFLSNFEKKLALLARAKLSEPDIIYYGNIFNDMDDEKRSFYTQKIIDFHTEDLKRITIISVRSENDLKSVKEIGFNKIIKI